MAVYKAMVIGGGVIGCGIVRLLAGTGIEVLLMDLNQEAIKKSLELVSKKMDAEIDKWGLTKSEKKATLSHIKGTTDLEGASSCDVLIEAIPENLNLKKELFEKLDRVCNDDAILATNTSTLSVSEISSATTHPERVVGVHFIPPVNKIPIVEIFGGVKTSKKNLETFRKFIKEQLGKSVVLTDERCGHIAVRVIAPSLNEAMYLLMEGIASADDIDAVMKLGFGFNLGPLALADRMGLDEVESWMENLSREVSQDRYNPCPLLKDLVQAGHLGRKTGQGFFKYDEKGNKIGEAISYIKW